MFILHIAVKSELCLGAQIFIVFYKKYQIRKYLHLNLSMLKRIQLSN